MGERYWAAKQAKTITGVTLQKYVDRMDERQVREALKGLVWGVENHGGAGQISLSSLDDLFRSFTGPA